MGASLLTNLCIKTPLLRADENFILSGSLMKPQVAAQLSCPSCGSSGQNTPLESLDDTGNGSVESKNGRRPSKSHCLSSATPFFHSHTAVSHELHDSWLRGTCTLPRSGWRGRIVGNPSQDGTWGAGTVEEQFMVKKNQRRLKFTISIIYQGWNFGS